MTLMTITTPTVLLKDDFREGLDLTCLWAIVRLPPSLIADDGTVSTSDQGLYVRAAGTSPLTSEPAFTKTSTAENDHVKWMADTQHVSSNAVPGFDAVRGRELQINMWAHRRTFGTARHPFGTAVTNADTDLRLATFAMNTLDFETGMVFDVWMTNNAIYPYYERLKLRARQPMPLSHPRFLQSEERPTRTSRSAWRTTGRRASCPGSSMTRRSRE
jgi:hypothetical protein